MISRELLSSALYPQEGWINVYEYTWSNGDKTIKQGFCFASPRLVFGTSSIKLLYRIHVKLK